MVGVFFVPTNYVDAGGEQLLDWTRVLEMDRAGMEFGAHTMNHADLTKVNLVEVRRQLVEGKQKLEAKLGHPVLALSYPFGAYNPKVIAETAAAGYRAAVILCCGYKQRGDMLLMLPRIRVSYGDTVDALARKLP
jgi:peptidoglycan/xylan/chitin deacetylase (PgdA/CDA1 family)